MSFDLEKALSSIDLPLEWIGLREVREKTTIHYLREGHPQANSMSETHGVMVEVLVNNQFGYAATNQPGVAALQEAARRAYQQALSAAAYGIYKFDLSMRPATRGQYHTACQKNSSALTPGEINALLLDIYQALRVSDEIISASAMARLVESEHRFISSNGSNLEQSFLIVTTEASATARRGSLIQRRSDSGMFARSHQGGLELLDRTAMLERAARTGHEAVELLGAEECPGGEMDLLLAPDQMMLQIHESVGHPLELDRILGDERNYAGWSFVKPEDFGTLRYGSELMNITFDPGVPGEIASYGYDDGGLEAQREFIIKDGVLLRGLGGCESQIRSGLPGVANFRASSWNRPPIDRIANLNLEPGTSSYDEILSSIEKGVFMLSNRSWSIDDYRNKFQFGCEYAKLIENGKLTKTLRNPNYRGISTPFWNNLKMVGNRDTYEVFGTPNCGKGEPNQVIRTGHASPLALFGAVELFGGAG